MQNVLRNLIIVTISFFVITTQAASLSSLQKLIQEKNYVQAYALSQKLLDKYEGNPQFDFLYGLAALRTQHADQASFIFERLLLQHPNDPRVRLEYALAQLHIKNYPQAQHEFQHILKQNPPPNVQKNIRHFLALIDAIQTQSQPSKNTLSAFVRFNAGYDSNANSSTAENIINIPVFGSVALNPSARAAGTFFSGLQAGISGQLALNKNLSMFGSISGNGRRNTRAHQFDTNTTTAIAGLNWSKGRFSLTLPFMAQALELEHQRFRNTVAYALQGLYTLTRFTRVGGFIDHSRLLYPNNRTRTGVRAQDTNLTTGGPVFQHQFSKVPLVLTVKLFGGREDDRVENYPHLARRVYGTDDAIRWIISKMYEPYLGIRYQRSKYKGVVPGFLAYRSDHEFDLFTGIRIKLNKHWLLEPSYTYIDNASNTIIYAFKRHQFMLSLTYSTGQV
ncbi:MAG: tetratricopeptide repeat protein [Legionellales bacterium]|nr:tetratricopeptide repeat protein [Legionellales bacterium]